jgi:hypothetical protein
MDLTYVTIVVLASMIFVLSGMIGYLYWQQTRLHQNLQSLGIVVSTLVNQPPPPPPLEEEAPVQPEPPQEVVAQVEEDDRLSVEHVTETPAPAKEIDVDELESKTKPELFAILQEKGIPYNKSDKKSQLIEILKATS